MKLSTRSIHCSNNHDLIFPLGDAMTVRWTVIPEKSGFDKREKLSDATACLIKWSNYIPKCSRPLGLYNEPSGDTLAPPHEEPESVEGGSPATFRRKIDGSPPSTVPSANVWLDIVLK